jgi:hypothetical protein
MRRRKRTVKRMRPGLSVVTKSASGDHGAEPQGKRGTSHDGAVARHAARRPTLETRSGFPPVNALAHQGQRASRGNSDVLRTAAIPRHEVARDHVETDPLGRAGASDRQRHLRIVGHLSRFQPVRTTARDLADTVREGTAYSGLHKG